MTYKDILYFGTCVGCLSINSICACCSSEEKKLSKEYIAKALGVTVDKIWVFEVFSAEDAAKYKVKDKTYSGIVHPKIIVDKSSDGRYSNSCFVELLYVKDSKENKFCHALVSDKNNIKVNNEMLVDPSEGENKECGVLMTIFNDYTAWINEIVREANNNYVDLSSPSIQLTEIMQKVAKTMISNEKIKQYFCK